MKKITLKIPLTGYFAIEEFDYINEDLTDEFTKFYQSYFRDKIINVEDRFLDKIGKTLSDIAEDELTSTSDAIFSNFTPVSQNLIKNRKNKYAYELWQRLIIWAEKWRNDYKLELHLGTPYYFIAVASISQFDVDAGSIFMHLALTEDRNHHKKWHDLPANLFLSLNPDEKQYISDHTKYMLGFLRDRLDGKGNENGKYKQHYQTERSGSLEYSDLRMKFLDQRLDEYLEIKYFFVYSLLRLWRLRRIQKSNKGENVIAPLIYAQVIGGLLITIEDLLKKKYPRLDRFGNLFEKYSSDNKLGTPNLNQIQIDRDNDFEKWIQDCIGQKSTLGDFTLSYGLRNYAFHTIASQQIMWRKQTEILQSVLNCIFSVLEVL
ncbi:hypothetical protein JW796_00575 [Candidatus Dojkabacteria bacterium]|nr:hypothetical protein [Candidatus Dojkabacteria bacterium]